MRLSWLEIVANLYSVPAAEVRIVRVGAKSHLGHRLITVPFIKSTSNTAYGRA